MPLTSMYRCVGFLELLILPGRREFDAPIAHTAALRIGKRSRCRLPTPKRLKAIERRAIGECIECAKVPSIVRREIRKTQHTQAEPPDALADRAHVHAGLRALAHKERLVVRSIGAVLDEIRT